MPRPNRERRDPLHGQSTAVTVIEQTASDLYYDYAQLPDSERDLVRRAALDIKPRLKRAAEDIFVIGEKLRMVKERLPHGTYTEWLTVEFGISERMAQHFVGVRERLGIKSEKFSVLPPSMLYLLAAPSTPDAAIAAVEERIEAGERLTVASVQQTIRTVKAKENFSPAPQTIDLLPDPIHQPEGQPALLAEETELPIEALPMVKKLDHLLEETIASLSTPTAALWGILMSSALSQLPSQPVPRPPNDLERIRNELRTLQARLRRRWPKAGKSKR